MLVCLQVYIYLAIHQNKVGSTVPVVLSGSYVDGDHSNLAAVCLHNISTPHYMYIRFLEMFNFTWNHPTLIDSEWLNISTSKVISKFVIFHTAFIYLSNSLI